MEYLCCEISMKLHFKYWLMVLTPLVVGLVVLGLLTWRDISIREGRWLKLGDTVQPDCSDPINRRSIFHETAPTDAQFQFIAHVTILYKIVPSERELRAIGSDVTKHEKTAALAKIDGIIRGSIEATEIEIGPPPLCTDKGDYTIGASGIVVGRVIDPGNRWGVGPFWSLNPVTRATASS
jgi:hypothetical protein